MSTRDELLFPKLSAQQQACLHEYGAPVTLQAGERLFAEGENEHDFYVLLEGQIRITKNVAGEEVVLTVHETGEFTGALSLFTGAASIASAHAIGPGKLLRIDVHGFQQMLTGCPDVAGLILSAMAHRRPDADALAWQREKLASLGKMAAGLAHELNNPAAAARRAATQLRQTLAEIQERTTALFGRLEPGAWKMLADHARAAGERARDLPPLSPLDKSDREDAAERWLDEHNVANAWKLAPTLASGGSDTAWLDDLAAFVPPDALSDALSYLAALLYADGLLAETETSTTRIAELVNAIKRYTYRDQAPRQDVDVKDGLESTLTILNHKLRAKNIEITRAYADDLPRLSAYGGELNQVWTNLLDNAIHAAPLGGHITVEAARECDDTLLIAVSDDGPGIPAEIQARIFEPFFTTKPVGEGTGLGLDTAFRIITQRHKGDLRAVSGEAGQRGARFEVRLPLGGEKPSITPA